MNTTVIQNLSYPNVSMSVVNQYVSDGKGQIKVIEELKAVIKTALETYSNVHRGSGFNSMVTTHLFEQARTIILEYLGLSPKSRVVIFCSSLQAEKLKSQFKSESYCCLSSADFGLSVGVWALAVERKALKAKISFTAGGGTARLISRNWVIWAKNPDKFEAGTPAIVNIIAFASALGLVKKHGTEVFREVTVQHKTVLEIFHLGTLENFTGTGLLSELNKTLIGKGSNIPTIHGDRQFINFDNAASTPTFNSISETFFQALFQSRQVQLEIIREVRSICSQALNLSQNKYDILFTSNTTEAINLVAESLGNQASVDVEPVILNSLLEHNSNELPWRMVPGLSLLRLKIDADGFIDLNELESLLQAYNLRNEFGKKRIKLVSVSGASNVLGVCNDIQKISEIVHRYQAHLLVDAAQLVAHRIIDVEEWGIDFLAFSAHKMYAPFGSGALVARKGLLNFDADRSKTIQESGEENIAGIAAMGKAFALLQKIGMDTICREEQALTGYATDKLRQISGIIIYGMKDCKADNFAHKGGVIAFSLKGMMPDKLAGKLALYGGIGIRSGCHCSHILIKHLLKIPAPLEGFQGLIVSLFPKLELPGVARISFGLQNTRQEVDLFIQTLAEITGKPGTYSNSKVPDASPGEVKQMLREQMNRISKHVFTS